MNINIILAHRNSVRFMSQQVTLLRKLIKLNSGSRLKFFGYVDSENEKTRKLMSDKWLELDVEPIQVPEEISGVVRSETSCSESFGLSSQWVYENYIKNNTKDIFVCIESDVMPFKEINIEEYVKDFEVCGEIRFNSAFLPDRMNHFWLGLLIYNKSLMKNSDLWSSRHSDNLKSLNTGREYWADCGGESYFWIEKNKENRKIRQMVTKGNENYNGFSSNQCKPHQIGGDIENLPEIFRQNYDCTYRVLIYDDIFIHLGEMGKELIWCSHDEYTATKKFNWWLECYNKLK